MIVQFPAASKRPPITILHVIPTLEGGGAERQLSMLVEEQARRGHDVHVAVRRTGVHGRTVKDCGVQIHELGDLRSTNPRLFFAVRDAVVKIKPSIVQTWLPQMDILGGLAAFAARTPWIVSERTSANYYKDVPLIAWLRAFLGQFASAIVANSKDGEQYWRASSRSVNPVIIRNALDVARIREAIPPDPAELFSNPVLLVVGRFSREKALEIVVQAVGNFAVRSAVNVLIIGAGSERSTLEREIATASLSGCVKVLPYQSDWWRWLKVAAGLISMSRFEGNPNVVLEAMAGCCPVILSDIPAHREIADASSASFVPVDDVDALASAIGKLLGDKEAALRRAARASERVELMTVAAMADAYDVVYREALGGTN